MKDASIRPTGTLPTAIRWPFGPAADCFWTDLTDGRFVGA